MATGPASIENDRATPAAVSAIVAGGLVTGVWTWGLDEPFAITGLIAGVVTNLVVYVAVVALRPTQTPTVQLSTAKEMS